MDTRLRCMSVWGQTLLTGSPEHPELVEGCGFAKTRILRQAQDASSYLPKNQFAPEVAYTSRLSRDDPLRLPSLGNQVG
jgi:hypothetical protein